MDIERVEEAIKKGEVCVLRGTPRLKKKEIIIERIEFRNDKNNRVFAIVHFVSDEKEKKYRFDIRNIDVRRKINDPKPFPEDRKHELEEKEKEKLHTYGIIGEHADTIKWMLAINSTKNSGKTMLFKTLRFPAGKKGISAPTTRFDHSANIGRVAYLLAEYLLPEYHNAQIGIGVSAQDHDIGHTPFGHEAEVAKNMVLENYGGGVSLHEPEGAVKTRYRYEKAIKEGILFAPVIREARRIINEEEKENVGRKLSNIEYIERVNKKINELIEAIEIGKNPELKGKVKDQEKQYGAYLDEAVRLMEMAAGSHDGERGVPHIVPDYSLEYEDYWKKIFATFLDQNAKKELGVGNIGAAIVRIADQISYIVFDMIDGIRAGIENEIPEEWVKPVAMILGISSKDARDRLNGGDEDRYLLALDIQYKVIEDIVTHSNSREIDMSEDMKKLLYTGLRAPNREKHIVRSSTKEEEKIIINLYIDLTDKLVNSMVDEKGAFDANLNDLFHLSSTNPNRDNKEENYMKNVTDNNLRDFFDYCVKTSSEEYSFYKGLAVAGEIQKFRELIVNALDDRSLGGYIPNNFTRGTMGYAIRTVIGGRGIDLIEPQEDGTYSDDDILTLVDRINGSLRADPVEGVKNLDFIVRREQRRKDGTRVLMERKLGRDERIAARIALGYLGSLTEEEIVDLGKRLGVLTENDISILYKPYNTNEGSHSSASSENAANAYEAAEAEMRTGFE